MIDAKCADSRLSVLYLFPGPRWHFDREFTARLSSLQKHLKPHFFTSTDFDTDIREGNAELRSFAYRNNRGIGKLVYYYRYLSHALSYAREIGDSTGRLSAIVTYDPLATGMMGLFIGWRTGVPVICEINGCFDDKALYMNRPIIGKLKRRLNLAIIRWVSRHAAGVKKLFEGQLSGIIEPDIHSLILFDHVSTENFYQSAGDKIILAVGAPFFPKGFEDLIRAFQRLPDVYSDWRLRIIGHFDGDHAAIQSLVKGHPRIDICKAVMPEKVPGEMARAEIFVLPSKSEGVPRVLLEAMASGTARIASKVGGIPTIINDNDDGLLFDAGNVDQLYDKLVYLVSNPDDRRRIGDAGLNRLRNEYSIGIYTSKYVEFILEVVKRANQGPVVGSK